MIGHCDVVSCAPIKRQKKNKTSVLTRIRANTVPPSHTTAAIHRCWPDIPVSSVPGPHPVFTYETPLPVPIPIPLLPSPSSSRQNRKAGHTHTHRTTTIPSLLAYGGEGNKTSITTMMYYNTYQFFPYSFINIK